MVLTVCNTTILCRNQQTQKEFRNEIKVWLKSNYLNKMYLNEETNYSIFINNTFINKVTTKFGDVKAHALTSIPNIIKNAVYIKSEDDNRERADILKVLKFESLIEADGLQYVVWLYVRQTRKQLQLYSLNIKA